MNENERYNPENFAEQFNQLLEPFMDVKHRAGMIFGEEGKVLANERDQHYSGLVDLTAQTLRNAKSAENTRNIIHEATKPRVAKAGFIQWGGNPAVFLTDVLVRVVELTQPPERI